MKIRIITMAILFQVLLMATSCKTEKKQSNESSEAVEIVAVETKDVLQLDTNASYIEWYGSKPGGHHVGKLYFESGEIRGDKENKAIQNGTFIIDMNSINNSDFEGEMKAKLENHLKSEDFFDVTKYPTSCFEIASVEAQGEVDSYKITGNLTIKDITLSISFSATIKETNGVFTAVSEPIILDRTKWGVNYGSKNIFKDLKDNFIEDQMKVTLHLQTM